MTEKQPISWCDKIANSYINKMYVRHTLDVNNNYVDCPIGTNSKKLVTCLECQFLEGTEKESGDYTQIICKPPTNIPYA